ncbi:MAG TPA: hydrogenase expression protein [Chloroflexi bacterium]|nr:hydrogenase expression protein [Chloroflexota bacterium]
MTYPTGKLPAEHLARLMARYAPSDERVILGPGIGHDAAAITFGDRCLVAKSDPITFATDEIGWYAVHINANDVACLGATPRWFLATLLLPEHHTDTALVDAIFDQLVSACEQLNVGLVGGHTEITYGFDRPIVVGCMLGEVAAGRLVRSDGARPGDVLLLTKGIAVEGTALLAREMPNPLEDIDPTLLERCRNFLHDPGISVVRDATVATAAGDVHAMHDPTEGGLSTGLWEMAETTQVGMVIDEPAIPIFAETETLCAHLGLNPLGLIASGALLMAVAPASAAAIVAALEGEGIAATRIGQVTTRARHILLRNGAAERPLPRFARDEIVSALTAQTGNT